MLPFLKNMKYKLMFHEFGRGILTCPSLENYKGVLNIIESSVWQEPRPRDKRRVSCDID